MRVLTSAPKRGQLSLQIGGAQAREFFPEKPAAIEIQLDDLRILCPLPRSFWQDRPEIHDLRLSAWLQAKRNAGKLAHGTAELTLLPIGDGTFRLLPTAPHPASAASSPGDWMAWPLLQISHSPASPQLVNSRR